MYTNFRVLINIFGHYQFVTCHRLFGTYVVVCVCLELSINQLFISSPMARHRLDVIEPSPVGAARVMSLAFDAHTHMHTHISESGSSSFIVLFVGFYEC